MKKRHVMIVGVLALLTTLAIVAAGVAQRGRGSRGYYYGQRYRRTIEPMWETDAKFKHDTFTFVRIEYSSWRGYGRGGGWATDYPDSDLNFSYRLQELTALEVNPVPVVLRLTDDELFDHPFIYLLEPGRLIFDDEEVKALRRYLINGGFLMVDDFWGEDEWYNFYIQFRRVFPDRELIELPLDHEIFHCVYDLEEKPQIPSINAALSGRSSERWDAQEPHFRALFDDNGRMMAIVCHNTDLGDGWEREGVDQWYFREYSEKRAYPLGINIVVYAMTH